MNDNKLHITYADNELMCINLGDHIISIENVDTAIMTTHVLFLCKKICQCMLSLGYDIESSITCTDILNMIFSQKE